MQKGDKEFYEKLSKKELSNQEAFEAKHNFVGFFDLLYRIDKRTNKQSEEKPSNSNKLRVQTNVRHSDTKYSR